MWMTPQERHVRARLAAHAMHSQHDSRLTTQRARKAFLDRFEREVDPDQLLTSDERARRASQARSSYFAALALKSAQARRRRKTKNAASVAGFANGRDEHAANAEGFLR